MIGRRWFLSALAAVSLAPACLDTSGGDRFFFVAAAAGPADAVAGQPLVFENGFGWRITLTKARVLVRSLYLNQAIPLSSASDSECFLQGVYVGQLTTGRSIDVLDPAPQFFPALGEATSGRARTGEIWLSGGPIDAIDDGTPVVEVEGTAARDGASFPFAATVTIGQNRAVPPPSEAVPGANPLCRQRIVSPIPIDVDLARGGDLLVRIDPRGWFRSVDFGALSPESDGRLVIPDRREAGPANNFFNGIRSREGVYAFAWTRLRANP